MPMVDATLREHKALRSVLQLHSIDLKRKDEYKKRKQGQENMGGME